MDVLLVIIAIVLGIIVILAIINVLRNARIVSEEERLVIYRLGRFHRVAGPGPVQLLPWFDRVMQTLEVRDHPLEITAPGIFVFGIPNELTLNLWCSFDLVRAAGGDKKKLATLVQLNDAERHRQVEVKVSQALVDQVAQLQERMPLPDNAALMDKVTALVPGTARYSSLLKGLKFELEKTLPSIGVVLDTTQPIVLTKRGLSEEIIESIKRQHGREMDSEWLTDYVDELRHRFPDLAISKGMLAQMLASIEGIDIGKVQRLFLEQEPDAEAEVELKLDKDGERSDVIIKPKPEKSATRAEPVQPTPSLTESDFAVLKRVPRSSHDEQMSA